MVSLGVAADGGRMATVVPRNTILPAKLSRTFTSNGIIEVLAGEHPLIKGSFKLGRLTLGPAIPRGARVRLSFSVDQEGLLTVAAEDEQSGQTVKALFHNYTL